MTKKSIFYYYQSIDMFGVPVTLFYHADSKVKKSYFGATMTLILWAIAINYLTERIVNIRSPKY